MRGAGDILGFQAEEVVRAYDKALDANDTRLATNLRAIHTDLTARFDAVDAERSVAVQ